MSKTTLSKTIEGLGNPTVQELRDLLEGLPLDARLTVENIEGDRPFDPRGWRIKATYEAPEAKKPFHAPPGYRSGGAKPRGLSPQAQQEQELHDRTQEVLSRADYKENGAEPARLTSDDFDNAGRPIDDPGNELTRTRPRVGTPESKMGLIQGPRIVKDSPQA